MTNQIWRKLYDDAFIGMDGNTPTKLLHEAFKSNDIEEQGTHSKQGILDLIISLEDIEVLVLSMSVDEKIRLLQLQAILRLILCRDPSNDELNHFDHVFSLLDRVAILLDLRKPLSMSQDDDESPPFLSFIKDKIAPSISASMATRILKYYEIDLDDSISNVKNAALKHISSAPTPNPTTLAAKSRSDVERSKKIKTCLLSRLTSEKNTNKRTRSTLEHKLYQITIPRVVKRKDVLRNPLSATLDDECTHRRPLGSAMNLAIGSRKAINLTSSEIRHNDDNSRNGRNKCFSLKAAADRLQNTGAASFVRVDTNLSAKKKSQLVTRTPERPSRTHGRIQRRVCIESSPPVNVIARRISESKLPLDHNREV